ncbi:MAG: hypothetical protein IPL49_17970 [Saprospirales bacterium]|nr:hypothetical protein [Saprospirales bacterium]
MTTAQRNAIASPATGLLVYDETTGGFWFYNGTVWQDLSADADADPTNELQTLGLSAPPQHLRRKQRRPGRNQYRQPNPEPDRYHPRHRPTATASTWPR